VGQRLSRREFGRVEQAVGDRGEDPAAGFAAMPADPGLGALGEDHLGQRLPEQVGLRGVEVGLHEFLASAGCAVTTPS
jgi:hypothetical protein